MTARHRNFKTSWESDSGEHEKPQKCSVSGKRMYATEGEANATAAHRMSDKQEKPGQLRSYLCIYCMAWHLTSAPVSTKRKK
jgi:hypothetical protein